MLLEFCPTEWRYYYDCVRVHSDGENLLIPIHAYPVINDVLFPVRIDFGRCVLNEQYTRTVKLECKVPIQFEYRCVRTLLKPYIRQYSLPETGAGRSPAGTTQKLPYSDGNVAEC